MPEPKDAVLEILKKIRQEMNARFDAVDEALAEMRHDLKQRRKAE